MTMTMTMKPTTESAPPEGLADPRFRESVEDLVQRAIMLSADVGQEVATAIRRASDQPLPEADVRRVFTRILSILKIDLRDDADEATKAQAHREIVGLVDDLLAARRARIDNGSPGATHLELQSRAGLSVRRVIPTPVFAGQPVELSEGYVDVRDLRLWEQNTRLEMQLDEFERLHHRRPDNDELVEILHGTLKLPGHASKKDEFKIKELAASIAAKGVQTPPIIDWYGVPRDGNRRIAACLYILKSGADEFGPEEKERAAWVRVYQAPEGTTDDQFHAIVVALNFEEDHKLPWPEYIKARQVAEEFFKLKDRAGVLISQTEDRDLRRTVAKRFAIKLAEVTRYVRMVQWAEKFEQYHQEERQLDPTEVRYRTNDLFQWFYELDAGRGPEKLSLRLEADDALRAVVFDLMFDDKLSNFTEVRNLRKVVADPKALEILLRAHAEPDRLQAQDLVDTAIIEARRADIAFKRIGFREWTEDAIKQMDEAPPTIWRDLDSQLLRNLRRALFSAQAAVEAELIERGIHTSGVEVEAPL